jgi:hypothetical protein
VVGYLNKVLNVALYIWADFSITLGLRLWEGRDLWHRKKIPALIFGDDLWHGLL